jgi:hypothetical protein
MLTPEELKYLEGSYRAKEVFGNLAVTLSFSVNSTLLLRLQSYQTIVIGHILSSSSSSNIGQ